MSNNQHPIVFFDGRCNLCNGAVQFIIRHDKNGLFHFAPLESKVASELIGDNIHANSIVLWQKGRVYTRSSAVLQIARQLDGGWKWWYGLVIIPRPIRDLAYRYVAHNRYRWFGQKESCMVPTPEIRARFLE